MTQQAFFKLYADILKNSIRKECNPNPYTKHYNYCIFWFDNYGNYAYASGDGSYSVTLSDGTDIYLFGHSGCIKTYDKEGNRIC